MLVKKTDNNSKNTKFENKIRSIKNLLCNAQLDLKASEILMVQLKKLITTRKWKATNTNGNKAQKIETIRK